MLRCFILALCVLLLPALAVAATPVFSETFDTPAAGWRGSGTVEAVADHGPVLHLHQTDADASTVRSIQLPVEQLRGAVVSWGALVRGDSVSQPPQSWNGVKVMLVIKTPDDTSYPQPHLPQGSFDWHRFSARFVIPADATAVTLVLGLEKVSGDAWFDDVRVSVVRKIVPAPAADPSQPIYTGHAVERLRGAMVPNTLQEKDFAEFADDWHANLVRWQLVRISPTTPTLESFDHWLDLQLRKLDQVLQWAQQHHVKLVVDLHSPPGGASLNGNYVAGMGGIFQSPAAQDKFIEAWQKMARRYKGNTAIWGFDLMNEPVDTETADDCLDWQDLSLKAARAIHAIDPDRTLIVEPGPWGGPQGFASFVPLDEPRIVYSFHFYIPMEITHQGVFKPSPPESYPGDVNGKHWDKAALAQAMQPAVDFARRYRVQMYVGEFSCIRTAPGNTRLNYLRDVIDLCEQHGFDWSYHAFREWQGWSVEHTGPLNHPQPATQPTAAEELLRSWYAKNQRP